MGCTVLWGVCKWVCEGVVSSVVSGLQVAVRGASNLA